MKFKQFDYYGLEWAVKALSKSFSLNDPNKAVKVAKKFSEDIYAHTGEGKHLEYITVYFELEAPRYFWQEFDTYRVGVTKYSESTMHTILKRDLTLDDFERDPVMDGYLEHWIKVINNLRTGGDVDSKTRKRLIKKLLPESFLQTRIIKTDIKTLNYIISQRQNHELPEWNTFCSKINKILKDIKELI